MVCKNGRIHLLSIWPMCDLDVFINVAEPLGQQQIFSWPIRQTIDLCCCQWP